MGKDKNDELRDEHETQEEHRQEVRDETGGADLGSQDERREEGDARHHG